MPAGWIPCAHFYPPHPLHDRNGGRQPFRRERHDAFQTLLSSYGDPELVALKRRVIDAVTAGRDPFGMAKASNRFARATVRVALRQLQAYDQLSAALAEWLALYDRDAPQSQGQAELQH